MDRIRKIAQLFICGFAGPEPDQHILKMIREFGIGGVILFSRNIKSPQQTAKLVQELQSASEIPLLIGIDQEGGRVSRLPSPFTRFPGNRAIGCSDSEELAYAFGKATAEELSAVGINLDFAPVLDIDTNPDNPIIGDRAFGKDPKRVAKLGCAVIQGLQENGVIACGKHFPGHGDTSLDSHLDLPTVSHKTERLWKTEISPFQKALACGLESIMTAHVLYPELDPDLPGTLSCNIIQKTLREKLGWNGVVFTDDLEMKAVEDRWGIESSCILTLQAGVDALLICEDPLKQEQGLHAVIRAVDTGVLPQRRIEESAARVLDLKHRRIRVPSTYDPENIEKIVGSASHCKLASTLNGYLKT